MTLLILYSNLYSNVRWVIKLQEQHSYLHVYSQYKILMNKKRNHEIAEKGQKYPHIFNRGYGVLTSQNHKVKHI